MADEKVKTRQDREQGSVCETPKNKAIERFEATAQESEEFLDIAGSVVDSALSDDPETTNRQFRQQVGE
jgi:hypothetical protein